MGFGSIACSREELIDGDAPLLQTSAQSSSFDTQALLINTPVDCEGPGWIISRDSILWIYDLNADPCASPSSLSNGSHHSDEGSAYFCSFAFDFLAMVEPLKFVDDPEGATVPSYDEDLEFQTRPNLNIL